MYNFGHQAKERARQQKQIDKASKRIMAKQKKANIKPSTPNAGSTVAEPGLAEDITPSAAFSILSSQKRKFLSPG